MTKKERLVECLKNGEWIQMDALIRALELPGDGHNSHGRRMLTEMIKDLNNDEDYHGIVIHGNKGVKLATGKEAASYIQSTYAEIFRKLKTVRKIEQKAKLNGQFTLYENEIKTFLEDRVS